MFRSAALVALTFAAVAFGQQVGTLTPENPPALTVSECTAGGCTASAKSITLDSNWRWLHSTNGSTNCYTGNSWDTTLCPNPTACANNCAIEGADYSGTYGISTSGNALTLKFVTNKNVGSRVYLLDNASSYKMFSLKNKEFTFDVDMSQLPCGLNGALYFSEMPRDGGMAGHSGNKAGAKYGTGYCDAQCPHDIKFINGEANTIGWAGSASDPNSGNGKYGACCDEMDIWEANSMAAAYTPHPCSKTGLYRCEGLECGDGSDRYQGVCDKDGCDFNSFRMGNKTFLGRGKTIDTTKKITVVTQFITADGTNTGALKEIRRVYVQNGVVYQNSVSNIPGVPASNSLTDAFCSAAKTAFGDNNQFAALGGMKGMGDSMANGMVLVMSIWDDHAANMLWLDSNYPLDKPATAPGVARGECATTSGAPAQVEQQYPNAQVTFSNIKFGTIGSTFSGTPGSSSSVAPSSSSVRPVSSSSSRPVTSSSSRPVTSSSSRPVTSSSSSSRPLSSSSSSSARPTPTGTAPRWGQCGGIGWTGPTVCTLPYTCQRLNDHYYQCL